MEKMKQSLTEDLRMKLMRMTMTTTLISFLKKWKNKKLEGQEHLFQPKHLVPSTRKKILSQR